MCMLIVAFTFRDPSLGLCFGGPWLIVALYLLRGAPQIVRFAYPDGPDFLSNFLKGLSSEPAEQVSVDKRQTETAAEQDSPADEG